PEGVRAYVDPPDISDRENRGVVTGRRVDRVTYVFERGGRIVLPSATQPWWDLDAGELKTAHAAGTIIDVASSPSSSADTATASYMWRLLAAAGAALLVILGVAVRYLIQRRRVTNAYAERTAFATLRGACSGADAHAIYRALARWRLYLAPGTSQRATEAAMS